MEHEVRLKRLMWACSLLALYLLVHFFLYWYFQAISIQRAEYKASIATLPRQIQEPMSRRAVERLIGTLEQLRAGGAQPDFGLSFEADSVSDFLGEDQFDMTATIALLQDNRLRPAKAKLELLATKIARVDLRQLRLLNILSYIGLAGAGILLFFSLYTGFRLRRHWSNEIAVLAAQETQSLIPTNFSEYLRAVVVEEVSFTDHRANITVKGVQTSELPAALNTVVEQLIEQLVRNSIEHGGRLPEKRVMGGKADALTIKVVIRELENAYWVAVRDDGEGIDYPAVIKRALDLKLISNKIADSLPIKQATKLLFLPGFQRADRQISRADNDQSLCELKMLVKTLSGVFSIQSEADKYSQFTVMFPKDALPSETVG